MRSPVRLSITAFLWLTSSLLVVVFAVVCFDAVTSIERISKSAALLKQKNLPEIVESQRSFTNIESLRRLAEVVYVSDNAKTRRSARITAQALAAESVFHDDSDFHQQAVQLAKRITALAVRRDAALKNGIRMQELAQAYLRSIQGMFAKGVDPDAIQIILNAYFATTLPHAGPVSISEHLSSKLEQCRLLDLDHIQGMYTECMRQASAVPDLAPVCDEQRDIYAQYAAEQKDLAGNVSGSHVQWELIDLSLREMRDDVGTDSEFTTRDALTSMEDTAISARRMSLMMFAGGGLFFLLYLFLLRGFIIRPVRWIADTLNEIRHGTVHTHPTTIRITELHVVAELLNRFSIHLAELYSHTSQLEEDSAEKRDLEELMRAVFQVSLDGYCVWSPGVFHVVSSGILRLFELREPGDLTAMRAELRLSSSEELEVAYARVIETGLLRREHTLRTANGEELPCEVTSLPVVRREELCVLSYFRDLREQKRTEHELRVAKESAEVAAQAKSDFLARMSHEIRTPMNGVLGLTYLALANSPPPEQRQYFEKIQASARILLGVINDILDFSKMESGKFTLEHIRFSLPGMLTTVVDLFSVQAQQKGLRFVLELDERIPAYLVGDELRLSQVLLNLCGNAVKFTEQGHVTLCIALLDRPPESSEQPRESTDPAGEGGKEQVTLQFTVRDTGVGMTEEQLSQLFQPFTQADTSTTRKYGGTGLGLVISKLLIEMMQGKLSVTSNSGFGSEFSFWLPLEQAPYEEEPTQHGDSAMVEEELPPGLRVLLAEDNEINQEIAVALLEQQGCRVRVAGNGAEALALLEEEEMDIVLMDIQMPIMDGLTAARHVRSQGRARVRDIPIIAMTAHAMREDREKSLAAGMNDHLTKPIDVTELRAVLLRWSRR